MVKRLLRISAALLFAVPLFAQKPPCPPAISHISLASGTFSPQLGVTFRLKNFDAMLVPMGKTAPTCYEKMTVVSHAEIFVSNESLSSIFSEKLKTSENQIRDFKVENGPEGATLTGKLAHVIPLSFSVEGPVTTDGSEIRLDAKKIKADGIPVKELLHMVGAEPSSVLRLKGMNGIIIEDNALLFSPEKVAHLRGHIASVTTSAEGLTLRYTPNAPVRSGTRRRASLPR